MTLPKSLTTVTTFSKLLAAILFILFPIIGFIAGMSYQKLLTLNQLSNENLTVSKLPTPTPIPIPTIDPSVTANWKIYRNTHLGIEFKYPPEPDYYLSEKQAVKPYLLDIRLTKNSRYGDLFFKISFETEKEVIEDAKMSDPIENTNLIIINGENGIKLSGYTGIGGSVYHEKVIFSKENLTYFFNYSTYEDKNLLDQILATFKFTN